ncbi:MAG: threonine-phosphate decarboxylase CobD [Proteobacteria bacterium]|nr:threonine-phosphate decarboxylase CobD [Pseudomonadota bacterium]
MTAHGGNIYSFMEKKGLDQRSVTDFSASINPLGTSKNVIQEIKKNLKNLIHYPDIHATRLIDKIAETLGVSKKSIVCGNGSTELIYLVPRIMGFRNVLIPQPTFSDYERACRIAYPSCTIKDYMLEHKNNFDIETEDLLNKILNAKPDAVFLCNPNNPTGRLIKKTSLLQIAEQAKKQKFYLIVDESFIDFCPGESVADKVEKNPYLIVLKSMTKFYALAGLRLGYGIFPANIAGMVQKHKEPWSVNTLAQSAGITALDDSAYKERTMKIVKKQKRVLEKGLQGLGIDYIPSHANYYLLHTPKALKIAEQLAKKGIMVRDCSNFEGLDHRYLRIAVKSQKENNLLLKYMEGCIE